MKIKTFLISVLVIIFVFNNTLFASAESLSGGCEVKKKNFTDSLTFDELMALSMIENPSDPLKSKLSRILYNPVVDNTISKHEMKLNKNFVLGDFVRVAHWNIARGLNFDNIKLIFEDEETLFKKIRDRKEKVDKKELEEIQKQINILKNTDIFLLNEVDIGMPRTKYRNIAEEFARMLGFNYAFGVEFVDLLFSCVRHATNINIIIFPI